LPCRDSSLQAHPKAPGNLPGKGYWAFSALLLPTLPPASASFANLKRIKEKSSSNFIDEALLYHNDLLYQPHFQVLKFKTERFTGIGSGSFQNVVRVNHGME
jgi:hypothetical protein